MVSNSATQSPVAPATIIVLDRSRQSLTRAQDAKIRNIFPFQGLPGELRNNIYECTLDWSDISLKLKKSMDARPHRTADVTYPPRSCPTVLLLNRQISSEALVILHKKPLVIDYPAENHLLEEGEIEEGLPPDVMRFITRPTLQNVRHLVLNIRGLEWLECLRHFLLAFATASASTSAVTKNTKAVQPPATSHFVVGNTSTQPTSSFPHLQSLHIVFRDSEKSDVLADRPSLGPYPDCFLLDALHPLSKIRGLEHVVIEGDLPPSYSEPLKAIMMAPVGVTKGLPKLMAVGVNGQEEEVEDLDWTLL